MHSQLFNHAGIIDWWEAERWHGHQKCFALKQHLDIAIDRKVGAVSSTKLLFEDTAERRRIESFIINKIKKLDDTLLKRTILAQDLQEDGKKQSAPQTLIDYQDLSYSDIIGGVIGGGVISSTIFAGSKFAPAALGLVGITSAVIAPISIGVGIAGLAWSAGNYLMKTRSNFAESLKNHVAKTVTDLSSDSVLARHYVRVHIIRDLQLGKLNDL